MLFIQANPTKRGLISAVNKVSSYSRVAHAAEPLRTAAMAVPRPGMWLLKSSPLSAAFKWQPKAAKIFIGSLTPGSAKPAPGAKFCRPLSGLRGRTVFAKGAKWKTGFC